MLPGTLDTLAPDDTGQSVGLRLENAGDTDFMVQRAVTVLGADRVAQVTKWQQARAEVGSDDRLLGQLFAVSGLGALLAAAFAASGAIGARVRGQLRDIAVLKAVGFTPGQVVRGFLVQHLAFALLGVALGTAAIAVLGERIPGPIGDAAALWQDLPGYAALMAGVPCGAILLIAAATGLAAWRAGGPPVPVARAAQPSGRADDRTRAAGARASGAAGAGPRLALGLPAPGPYGRRRGAPRAAAGADHGRAGGLVHTRPVPQPAGGDGDARGADRTAQQPGGPTEEELLRTLAEVPEVAAVHPGAEMAALVPGQTGTITLRGLGTAGRPYPSAVAEGRAPVVPTRRSRDRGCSTSSAYGSATGYG